MATNTVNPNNPPVSAEPVLQSGTNTFSAAWYLWFVTKVAKVINAPVSSSAPANSAAVGTPGQIAFDQNFLYVCIQANLWKRIALTAF